MLKQFPQLFTSISKRHFGHFNYFCTFSIWMYSVATGILKCYIYEKLGVVCNIMQARFLHFYLWEILTVQFTL